MNGSHSKTPNKYKSIDSLNLGIEINKTSIDEDSSNLNISFKRSPRSSSPYCASSGRCSDKIALKKANKKIKNLEQ